MRTVTGLFARAARAALGHCGIPQSLKAIGAGALLCLAAAGAISAPALAQGSGSFVGPTVVEKDTLSDTGPFEPGTVLDISFQVRSDYSEVSFSGATGYSYKDVEFSLDLDSVLTGLARTSPVSFTNCGPAPLASGTGLVDVSNIEVDPPAGFGQTICQITFEALIPADAAAGIYPISASTLNGIYFNDTTPDTAFTLDDSTPSFTVELDETAPVATLTGPDGLVENAPFDVSVSFDEPVTGLAVGDFTITGGTGSLSISGEGSFASAATLTVTPSGPGTVSIQLAGETVEDEHGNPNSTSAVETIEVGSPPTFAIEVTDDPVDPGNPATLQFSLTNTDASQTLTAGSFTINLANALSGLTFTSGDDSAFCGASSTLTGLSGNTLISVSGLELAPSGNCTFSVTLAVPGGASGGTYPLGTSSLSYTLGGTAFTGDLASGSLAVSGAEGTGAPASFSKSFSAGSVIAGGTVDLEFTIAAPELASTTAMTFTDDLDAMLSGLVATGLPASDVCGAGSSLTGTSTLTLTGGNLPVGGSCTFSVTLQVPAGAAGGTYPNTTSALTGTQTEDSTDSALNVAAATDSLDVFAAVPATSITGPSTDRGVGVAFEVTIEFSEPVTGFVIGDITPANATLSNFNQIDPSQYTVDVTPSATGAVTIDVAGGVAIDSDSNANTAATQYSVTAVAAVPEIVVRGNGVEIADGDTTPTVADDTDFGSTDPTSGTVTKTFTIQNSGTGVLSLTGPTAVSLTGADAGDFSVTQPSSLSLDPGASTTFSVTYDPSAVAVDAATVNIASNDADENPYDFAIQGTGTSAPEIDITGNGVSIPDGDNSPATADHTDFGATELGGDTIVRTFTIENLGSATLNLDSPAVTLSGLGAGDFAVTTQPASATVAASGSATFQITYTASSVGVSNAIVSVGNDDASEDPYTFEITAEATGGPEADLELSGVPIADGASASGGTALGDTLVASTVTRTFTIRNSGTTTLNLSSPPTTQGEPAFPQVAIAEVLGSADFTVTSQPASSVAAGGSTTFQVSYTPSATGAASATIGFGSNDLDETRYTFAMSATGVTPEIAVEGDAATDIPDGDTTPVLADGTDFGDAGISTGSGSQVFTIRNTGTGVLTLGADAVSLSGADSADFSITSQPAASVAIGASTTFEIEFDPSALGVRAATVSIANDDLDESPFDFAIQGTGTDDIAPTVTIGSAASDPVSGIFTVDIDFSESVTGLLLADIAVGNGSASNFAGSGSSYTVDITPSSDGTVTVDLPAGAAQDAAGNDNTAATQFSIQSDGTAPTVTIGTAASDPVSGAFTVSLDFSEPVTGLVLADIAVGNGTASNLAGSGDSYTADITPATDGPVTVDLPAGAAQDAAGNDNTAASQFSIENDGTAPTVTIGSAASDPVSGAFTVSLDFSEPVTGLVLADIAVGNGTASNLAGSGASYTTDITPSSDGTVTVDLPAGAAQDSAGNDNTAATQFAIEADATAPTVTIGSAASDPVSGAFTVSLDFSEPVTGLVLADLAVGNGTASNLAGSGDAYTVDVTPSGDGTVTVDLPAGVAQDAAGNGNTAATQFSIVADLTGPAVTLSTAASDPVSGAFTVSIDFTEPVTGLTLGDIAVGNGTASNLAGSGDSYTVDITPSGDGTLTVDLTAGVAQDSAGNDNTAAAQFSIESDGTAPTVAISSATSDPVSGVFSVSLDFSEPVTGLVLADIAVGNGTASNLAGSGDAYTVDVTPSGDGPVTVDLPAGAAQDSAGNDNTAAAQFSIESDGTAPTVTITSAASDPVSGVFTVDIDFSETVTGLVLADLAVGNGTASNLAGSGASYTADITPSGDGTVTVDLPAGVAQDSAGNDNTAAAQYSIESDGTAPTVAISSAASDPVSGVFSVSLDFSEPVTGLVLADIAVGNGTASNLTGSGDAYTVDVTPSGDGTVTVDLPAGAAQDSAGNDNTAAAQFSIQSDGTAPTVAISSAASDPVSGAFSVSLDFSEPVTGLVLADIAVGNGTASNLSGSGDAYTVDITPSSDGTVTVDLAAGVAQDAAGNGNTAAAQFTIEADGSAPVVLSAAASDDVLRLDDVGDSFTLTLDFSEEMDPSVPGTVSFDQDVSSTLTVTGESFDAAGTTYTVTFSVADGGQSLANIDISVSGFADLAGNAIADTPFADLFAIEMTRSAITVETVILGSVEGSFDFSGDLGSFVQTTSGQSGSDTFPGLAEGSYSFSIAEEDGFDLTGISCTGADAAVDVGAGSVSVDLDPDETAVCTFEMTAEPQVDDSITVDVDITLPPVFEDPSSVSTTFPLTNTGGLPLAYRITVDVPWLSITPSEGEIPAGGTVDFTVSFTDAVLDLAPGSYTATITFENLSASGTSSSGANASPQAITNSVLQIPVTIQIESRSGTVTLVTTTSPGIAGDGVFGYASDLAAFSGQIETSSSVGRIGPVEVERGSYTISQIAQDAWRLDSISCSGDTDAGSVVDLSSNQVTIDLDTDEAIVCTFANVRDEDYVRRITTTAIRDFMAQRADRILTSSPRLGDRLRQGRAASGANAFMADITQGRSELGFSASLAATRARFDDGRSEDSETDAYQSSLALADAGSENGIDVWIQANYSGAEDNRAGLDSSNRFGMLYVGTDMPVSPNLLVGALIQVDRMETVTGELRSEVEGTGWMAGPYVAARLSENLYLDVRGAWGRSDNTVNPLGLYEDEFETSRWLVEANLVGDMIRGPWRISPEAGLAYFSEDSDGYIDSLGIDIPGQSVTLGRLRAGPEIAYRFDHGEGAFVEPYVRLSAIYNYDEADVYNALGTLEGLGTFRADARLGLTAQFANGGRLSGEISFNGLGDDDFDATGAQLRLRLPLSLQGLQ